MSKHADIYEKVVECGSKKIMISEYPDVTEIKTVDML
jgi:hypothetical protein